MKASSRLCDSGGTHPDSHSQSSRPGRKVTLSTQARPASVSCFLCSPCGSRYCTHGGGRSDKLSPLRTTGSANITSVQRLARRFWGRFVPRTGVPGAVEGLEGWPWREDGGGCREQDHPIISLKFLPATRAPGRKLGERTSLCTLGRQSWDPAGEVRSDRPVPKYSRLN